MILKVAYLHAYWNKTPTLASLPPYHPKILGFQQFVAALGKENDDLYSVAMIPTNFPVQRNIVNITRMKTKEGEHILYVDLQAVQDINYQG